MLRDSKYNHNVTWTYLWAWDITPEHTEKPNEG